MIKATLAAAALACALPALADWQYRTTQDVMTSKEATIALLESDNSLALDFPYRGKNHGGIQIRQHPKYGLDAMVFVEKGQMLCRSYDDGCGVMVRFDNAPPVRYSGNPPADHSSTVIFLRDTKRFIAAASKAKRILVQIPFFHNGEQVLEFSSSLPLQWGPAKKTGPATPPVQWPKPPASLSGTR